MKKVLWIISCMSSILHAMHTDDEYKKMHTQLICQKYATLSPIKYQEHEGYIYAYYAPQEKKTRILIARNNGTYEKASIDTDQDIKTPSRLIDLRGYKGFLHAYENGVKNGNLDQLTLKI
jgi:hypothetical protein